MELSIQDNIQSFVYQYLGKSGEKVLDFIGDFIIALLILIIGFKLIKYIVRVLENIFKHSGMDDTLRTFLISFCKIALKILVIFMAITKVGVGTSSIIALLGSSCLALGMSLQGSLSNIAGGVILLFMKPFSVGEYISVSSSNQEGTVKSIGIMYTKLHTLDNRVVLIPNGTLSNSVITNVTHQDKRRVDLMIGVSYDADIRQVKEVLNDIIDQEEKCLREEPIQVFVNEFKDSCIEMGIRFWVTTGDYWMAKCNTNERIKIEFDKHGIEIPYNKLDVNIINTQ